LVEKVEVLFADVTGAFYEADLTVWNETLGIVAENVLESRLTGAFSINHRVRLLLAMGADTVVLYTECAALVCAALQPVGAIDLAVRAC
jgi:hypothetical protein